MSIPGQGQPLEKAVIANVDIPGCRSNHADGAAAQSRYHAACLPYGRAHLHDPRQTIPNVWIRDVGPPAVQERGGGRGTPVAGLPVPVRENLFLIGLSNLQADMARNMELLVRRNWVDLPVRMVSGQRAIMSFEKGGSGEQVMNDAFRQWQYQPPGCEKSRAPSAAFSVVIRYKA